MKSFFITLVLLILGGIPLGVQAQVETTQIDTVVIDSTLLVPVVLGSPPDQNEPEPDKPPFEVIPWEFHAPMDAKLTATDSTLRWQIWPDWTYKLNRKPGVISYRMGTSDRTNAVQYFAHGPRHQQLNWENISLNDPVTGMVHWSLIPQNKVGEFYTRDLGTYYRSTYYHRQYYLTEPLSRLMYKESSFAKRDLEFEVSHNITKRVNIEVSYLNKRAGGEYPNSEVTGNQIFGKVSYHLDPRRYLKLNYLNNSKTVGRPFGYNIADLRIFNFNRYTANANQGSAESQKSSSLLALSLYQRSRSPEQGADDFQSSLYYRGNERSIDFLTDSTGYQTRSLGLTARKWLDLGVLDMEGGGGYEYLINEPTEDSTLTRGNWHLFQGEGLLSTDIIPFMEIQSGGEFQWRSDGYTSYRLNAEADIRLGGFTLTPGVSTGTKMPTPQDLYWSHAEIAGNPNLENEKIQEIRGLLNYQLTPEFLLGIRMQHKDITDGIMVTDSSFNNVSPYASQSATAYMKWESASFELNGSATVHQFSNSLTTTAAVPDNLPVEERFWLKGSVYWKGYLLDRATYVKAGLSGMMAPLRYQADHYNPSLDRWQPISNDQLLPVYNSLDVDISARVRSLMFIMRWENVLDDVNQLGYFETAEYPMSQRRFIIGIRALFRN